MKKKLPSEWCVRVEENSHPLIVHEWRTIIMNKGHWASAGFLTESGVHLTIKPGDRLELTLQEFKILVLKEEPENYTYLIEFFKKLNIK